MFSATFLGHQGWLLSGERACILVDPLLSETVGHAGVVGKVYPPRELDLAGFPGIHAVLVTHEHEDHFDLPSLNRLDRAIPILLSARSSIAARRILEEMKFEVVLVNPGDTATVGDLELQFFSPDHVASPAGDEWDVLQYLVRDLGGDGSFFSYVDASASPATVRSIRKTLKAPGMWVHTNNATNMSMLELGEPSDGSLLDIGSVAIAMLNDVTAKRLRWTSPVLQLFAGGGFSFTGDLAWLNHHVFYADSDRLCASLAALFPEERFVATRPGETFHMQQGALAGSEPRTAFLTTAPPASWPSRAYREVEELQDYAPASGRPELTDAELEELLACLHELAGYLYAHAGFKKLYSTPSPTLAGRKAAFALQLIADPEGGAYVLEYQPQGCRFELVECEDPLAAYVVGVECWGTDLLGLFRGEFGPTSIVFGRGRSWNYAADALGGVFSLTALLWEFFHPLRRPAAFLALYRRLLAREPAEVPRVPAGRRLEVQVVARPAPDALPGLLADGPA